MTYFGRRAAKFDWLQRVPLFRGLSKRQLSHLARHADEATAAPGRVLVREGQMGRELVIIVEGTAEVRRGNRRIADLGPGDFFGEMSLIDGKPRSASVVAKAPMVLLTIHSRSFKPLLETVPRLNESVMKTLVARVRKAEAGSLD